MNVRKPIAMIAAMLITAAGMIAIANYSNAAADSARHAANASIMVIKTLPTIQVTPSAAQLRQLRQEASGGTVKSAAVLRSDAGMPFYSFASDAVSV